MFKKILSAASILSMAACITSQDAPVDFPALRASEGVYLGDVHITTADGSTRINVFNDVERYQDESGNIIFSSVKM